MTLVLASRGSALALRQAEVVRAQLQERRVAVDIRVVRTTGDWTDAPLAAVGTTGIFTKEVDLAVLEGRADLALHSLKDLPTDTTEGLVIGAVPAREDPRDVFVPAPGRPNVLAELPPGARVGTSSLRRRALLRELRPDLEVHELRGNLDTRLERVAAAELDGAIVARAGLRRIGRDDVIGEIMDPIEWVPAPGQGALAIVARAGDDAVLSVIAALDDSVTRAETAAERAFLHELRGGCQVPVGAVARASGGRVALRGLIAPLDGVGALRGDASGDTGAAEDLGRELAAEMLRSGGAEILAAVRAHTAPLPRATAP